jgi:RNA polymerase sigma factor (sigma-70 family)
MRLSDEQLVAAYRAGNDSAFDQIFDRYRPVLLRYARRVLGGGSEVAEDVVQEAMWRAARALRRDDREMNLKPWLFRLTRNCALDEVARVRTDSVATELDDLDAAGALRADDYHEPEAAFDRRAEMGDVLGDLAGLPENQRHALLRREVDGITHAQLAVELGVSEQASKNLVFRARTNLVKQREARTDQCEDVQRALLVAHDGHKRATAAAYRHLATCADCRMFRAGLRSTRKTMAILTPGPLLLLAAGGIGFASLKAASSAAAATTKGVAVKATATAATGVVAFGAVELGTQVFTGGDPAPQPLSATGPVGSPSLRAGVGAGEPIPAGSAVVRSTVQLSAGTTRFPPVVLQCPPGHRVADLLPSQTGPLMPQYSAGTVIGTSRAARVELAGGPLPRPSRVTVNVLCKQPDEQGSLRAEPRYGPSGGARAAGGGAAANATATGQAFVVTAPGEQDTVTSIRRGQPVRVLERRDGWAQIRTDAGETGWVRGSVVERDR